MKDNNKIIYLVLLIAVTVSAVGLATFAYFSSSVSVNANVPMNVATANGSVFTASSEGGIDLDLGFGQMSQANVSTNIVASDNATVTVKLDSESENDAMVCTYDLVWVWDSEDKYTEADVTLPYTEDDKTYPYELSSKVDEDTEKDLSSFTWNEVDTKYEAVIGSKEIRVNGKGSATNTHQVNVSAYNIPVNQANLFNKEFKAHIEVKHNKCQAVKPDNGNSVFAWDELPLLNSTIDSSLNAIKDLNITRLYLSGSQKKITDNKEIYQNIIKNLNSNGISTYFLFGDSSWYNDIEIIKNYIDTVAEYNSLVNPEERTKGIIIDIEAYISEEYKLDVINNFVIFSNTCEQIYAYTQEKGLELIMIIPYWYDNYFTDTETYTTEENQRAEIALERIIKSCDYISVMNYHKSTMVSHIENELNIAKKYDKNIESIGEFQRQDGSSIPESITFWPEDNPIENAHAKWNEIKNAYNYNKLTFSYHTLNDILEIKSDFRNYIFEVIDEAKDAITTVNHLAIKIEENEYYVEKINKKIVHSENMKVNYYLEDYKVVSFTETDLGDNTSKITLVASPLELYTLEIYSKRYSSEEDKYVSLKAGTVKLYDPIFKTTRDKTFVGDYAAVTKVHSDREYEISFLDENNNEYVLDYATAKDGNSVVQTISNSSGKIIIPTGFKSSLYIAPSLYLQMKN